eukprot:3323184-Lingulodinium_polyedra.AAC.1
MAPLTAPSLLFRTRPPPHACLRFPTGGPMGPSSNSARVASRGAYGPFTSGPFAGPTSELPTA